MTPATADNRITNTRQQTAQTCLRKHFLRYELGIARDTEEAPLRIGRAVHEGLDGLTLPDQERIQAVMALCASDTEEEQVERQTIGCLLGGYAWRWSETDADTRIIASELEFNLPLVNPDSGRASRTFTFAGKIDKIVERDGKLFVREHKTTGSDLDIGSDYWRRLRIDTQVSLYLWAAKDSGYDVQGVEYDVLRKPTIRPKKLTQAMTADVVSSDRYCGTALDLCVTTEPLRITVNGRAAEVDESGKAPVMRETPEMFAARLAQDMGERPDFYFARQTISRTADDLQDAQLQLWQIAKLLRDCERHSRWPMNTQACIGYGRCPYFDLCTNGFDPASGILPDGYVASDDVHPELSD